MSPLRALLPIAVALLVSGAARKPTISVRFHVEASNNSGGPFSMPAKFVNPPRSGFIESVPFASEKNVKQIWPVQNPDGSLGCAFQLDPSGTLALRTVTTERRNTASVVGFIATKTGTHQLLDLPIDKPITDGLIYIPRGFSPGEIEVLKETFPMVGATKPLPKPKRPKGPKPPKPPKQPSLAPAQ